MRKNVLEAKGVLPALVMVAGAPLWPRISWAGVEARLSDDAYVDSSAPTSNFGNNTSLFVTAPTAKTSTRKTFIKFDLSTLPASTTGADVEKANLKLFVSKVAANGSFNVLRVDGSWSEAGITYNNAPLLGPVQTTRALTTTDINDYITIDIT